MRIKTINAVALMVTTGAIQPVLASQQSDATGFVEGSKASINIRNMFMNRNFRQSSAPQSFGEEWAQGFIGTFQSGFTQGTVGFGVDVLGQFGMKLDTGDGRTGGGTGLLEQDKDGAKDNYSKLGGALKVQVSNSVLKYGNQLMSLPILSTSDARLLPESATGLSLTSNEIKNLTFSAGHFTGLNNRNDSKPDSARLTSLDYVGGFYKFSDRLTGSLFYQKVEDYWRKYYGSTTYAIPLTKTQALNFDFNIYDTKSSGEARAGELDNRIWSLSAAYTLGAHRFLIGHQRVSGRGDYQYGIDGLSTVYVGNSIQYSDFNYQDEKSWQVRYDMNLAPYGIPGLTFMTRYVKGTGFDTAATNNGHAWERDIESKYVVQEGPAKNLSFRLRHASYRSSDRGGEIDEIRIITEYPLNIF
ncbi:OprD family porin [Pseudomonas reactans]|jgi:imipenem/basic amino acid-specific outer membrane pore|uniref:OprD family porin n=3 Tax=Pseudomonas TaxID=286 RepID=A0A7Y8G6K8_9PSED|nr:MULTISPECIES: OprD family porin [Pseudomonas]ASV34837.1 outer membrane porin, OprD family [Pseudomonas sp. NS1(2017)]KGE68607.1 porin [Pseudomonas fluorescens LMG 5329]NWA45666.1 OprD family porin [Pseudomonas reactans]NWB30117.1 OprD family porin [Pseudomonas gingeri]NWC36591.1 OprD family porin [Pseudomonas gingeri]